MRELRANRDPAAPATNGENRRLRMRRLLVRVGVVALALLALVVLPGYVGTRPGFFARYDSMAEQQATWSTSTHAEAACNDCHVAPRALSQGVFRGRMVGEFYLSLVSRSRTPKVFSRPTNAACLACHNDLRSVSPKGDLQIPHRAHVQVLKMECVECHDFLVHEKSPEGKNTPPMSGCLKCHDGDTADRDCNACHTEKAAPETHRAADWVIEHPAEASEAKCAKCHKWAENWCAECHSHRPRSHGRNWRAVHGQHVAKHRSCEACHRTEFCVPCHGEVPRQNLNPALRLVE